MYSSITDVRNALTPGGEADDISTASSLTDAQIVDAIAEADSVVDTYVAARYTIVQDTDDPTVAVAPIRYFSRDIAAYLATLTFKRNKDVVRDDPVRLRYQMVMDILVAVRDGKANLDLEVIGATDEDGNAAIFNTYEGEMFRLEQYGLGVNKVIWPHHPYGVY